MAELAQDIERNIRRNLGVFSAPKFNHSGDPYDKHATRPTIVTRAGLSRNPSSGYWRQRIEKEARGARAPTAPPGYAGGAVKSVRSTTSVGGAPPPPAPSEFVPGATATAAAPATSPPKSVMPPGYYMVPTVQADGSTTYALSYVPFYFESPN